MREDLTGRVLGPYRLEALIGRGGMATVYRAHQASMQRDVAIKVMAAHLANNAEFVARFKREARVIARLQHPHILPVIDFGRADGYIFLVMQLVRGGVLGHKLRQPLTLRQVGRFLVQIASALEYAHRRGVVHRDLKPTNVLLDEEDNIYLTDFGIAKMIAVATNSLSLTATGRVMGTPAYMAPEQWRSEAVDARTDIYALGIMLYEMLLGALPFQSETPFGLMYKHFDQAPPPPRALNPSLPPAVEQVVLRALAKAPKERYASAQQMAVEFARALRPLSAERLAAPLPRVTQEEVARATPPAGSRATAAPRPPAVAGASAAQGAALPPTDFAPSKAGTGFRARSAATPVKPRARGRAGRRRLVTVYRFLALVLMVALGGSVWWWWSGQSARSAPAVAVRRTDTPTAAPLIVILSSPSATAPPRSTEKTSFFQRATLTPAADGHRAEVSATAHATRVWPTATQTSTATPNLAATAEALLAQRLTETAVARTDTPTPDMHASVVAALTGTASRWTPTPSPTPSATPTRTLRPSPTASATSRACGALPARMRVGQGGRTALDPPLPTALRASPSFDAAIVHTLSPGQTFVVVRGPECADGVRWWRVEGMDGNGHWVGWVGEGKEDAYWIEPFDTGPWACPSAPPPRLVVGETGRITLQPPLPSRVRRTPRVESGNIVGQLEPGEVFLVVSGPVCDEERGWRWWLVEGAELFGWVAEGPMGEYWMEPWP